jgi:hypothetical protein
LHSQSSYKLFVPIWHVTGSAVALELHQIGYLFALATGIVSSGLIGSMWAAAMFESPHFGLLSDGDMLTPIKVPVVVFSAPTTLIVNAFSATLERPLLGIIMLLVGLGWSFLQGVFILTQVFGIL